MKDGSLGLSFCVLLYWNMTNESTHLPEKTKCLDFLFELSVKLGELIVNLYVHVTEVFGIYVCSNQLPIFKEHVFFM